MGWIKHLQEEMNTAINFNDFWGGNRWNLKNIYIFSTQQLISWDHLLLNFITFKKP